ncbi:DoxX family protein [Saccharomonospora piscinae]|uniref:DoxX family protein n=1 Tax=Saccharomonospora piscinae TaxID=687388 RepID=UPI00110646AA|nr:DoxX family protein [Saccharomonospora piscinae]TLW90726.1 DoxX family protein [Saccharomonospora piscinae]
MSVHQGDDQPTTTLRTSDFDGSGFTAAPAAASTPTDDTGGRAAVGDRWHGGLDFGLLVLRIAVAGIVIAHGLQKFGLLGGPGIGGFAEALTAMGFTSQTTLLSWITASSEVVGGVLLLVGLFTPLGAAAVIGVMVNVVYAKAGQGFFAGDGGFEFDLLVALAAFALLFTGAGRLALDRNTPWRRRPLPFALVALVLAAAASVTVIVLFR